MSKVFFFGTFIFVLIFQFAHADNATNSHIEVENLSVIDTLLPISVISTDKMNIMVDVQKELIALQWKGLNREDRNVVLTDSSGKMYDQKQMFAGSTIVYFETQTLYEGSYILKVSDQYGWIYQNLKIIKPE